MDDAWTWTSPHVARGLGRLRRELPAGLQPGYDELLTRTRLPIVPHRVVPQDPLALPVLQLPRWLALRLDRQGLRVPDRAVAHAALAAALGYLHVRLQDDRLDDARGDEAQALLLGSVLLLHHQAHLALAAGREFRGARALVHRAWQAYAAAMLLELQLDRTSGAWSEATWRQSLGRYAPMALAPAMLLARAGRAADSAELQRMLMILAESHQAFEDTWDLDADLREGRVTWSGQQLGAHLDPDAARGTWLGGGLAATVVATEPMLLELAMAAQAWDLPELAEHAQQRRAGMRARVDSVADQLLATWSEGLSTARNRVA